MFLRCGIQEEICKYFLILCICCNKLNVALLYLQREGYTEIQNSTYIHICIFQTKYYKRILCLVKAGDTYAHNKSQIHLKRMGLLASFYNRTKVVQHKSVNFTCKWKAWTRQSPRYHLALWFWGNSIISLIVNSSACFSDDTI